MFLTSFLGVEVVDGGLRLSGDLDASTVQLLASRLNPLPGTTGPVTVHLGRVSYIDSIGLSELVAAYQRAGRAGRGLRLTDPSPAVVRLFEAAGLSMFLYVVPPG